MESIALQNGQEGSDRSGPLAEAVKKQHSPQITLNMLSKHTAGGGDIRSFLININTGDFSNGRNYRNKDASSGAVLLAGSPGPGPAGEEPSQPSIQKDFLAHWQMWTPK